MSDASTLGAMSPGLLKVVERAQREPEGRFHSLARLIDVPALRRAYDRQRKGAAVGVDGMTKEQYGQDLEVRLQDLHEVLEANYEQTSWTVRMASGPDAVPMTPCEPWTGVPIRVK